MKQGRRRTMSICITDLMQVPADRITTAGNKKQYISITTWDYNDEQLQNSDHDFAIMVTRTPEQKAAGDPVLFLGGGLIHDN